MGPSDGVSHKAAAMEVLNAALSAADPYEAVHAALTSHSAAVALIREHTKPGKVYVVGAGKAGEAMSRAAEEALGERISAGLVIVKDEHPTAPGKTAQQSKIQLIRAGHPVPDSRGVAATEELIRLVESAEVADLVVCLISGGGSALLTLPAEGVDLDDIQAVTAILLRAGATINELNAVRKHLSAVSGGQLARKAAPAHVLSLILSDVTGSPLDVIASGPTVPDPTTFTDALTILSHYGVSDSVRRRVLKRLERGEAGEIAETPKPGDPVFGNVTNILVASNVLAVEAAAARARQMGFNTKIVSTYLEGEARVVGKVLAGIAQEEIEYGRPLERPACLLFGGETTVTVRGSGTGGRNSELAQAAAIGIDGLGPDVVIASLATDGGDGSSPGAGGMVDGTTLDRGRAIGLDAQVYLDNNDSYTYLARTGDAIMTGPTGTNVNDIMGIFVFEK